jgi:hypothetical protein
METTVALFSQAELCEAAGIDRETANNWIKRGLLETTAVGGRKMRGRRLFSVLEIASSLPTSENLHKSGSIGPEGGRPLFWWGFGPLSA